MTYKVFLKDLGNKLKMQRKKLGLTQSELVEKINKGLNKNGDDSKDGKILQICGCLKNCSDSDIDTVLMLVQGMNSKNN